MAQAPSDDQVKQTLEQNQKEFQDKAAAQQAEGKAFLVPADGHGPGVVPEENWQQHKQPKEGQ